MTNLVIWGDQLRKLRKKADITQGQLVEQLSYLVSNLSSSEQKELASIDLYEEAATYFGGILDTPTLSKLERGKRTLSRKRTVVLVWGLAKLSMLETADQANRFLEAAGYGYLTPTEQDALFDIFEPALKPQKTTVIVPDAPMKQRGFSPRLIGTIVLVVGITLGLLSPRLFKRVALVEPNFTDDFSGEALNSELWEGQDATYASVKNGRLLFDTPVNQDEWYEQYIKSVPVTRLSRLTFDVVADTPETYEAGSIGATMGCWNGGGWLNVYAGEDPPHIFVEYASTDEAEGTDVHVISLRPIDRGEIYTVDLNWSNSEVEIMIDNELVNESIPCNRSPYLNIGVSIGYNQKVRGMVDQISVWHQ